MEIMPDIIKKNQTGFTLIELLVSMAIISIVVTGIVTSRMSQQNQSITQQQAVDVQQTVRAALSMMIQEIRMAGYRTQNDNFEVGIPNIWNGTWDGPSDGTWDEIEENKFSFSYTGEGKDDGIDNDGDGSIDEADEADIVYRKTIYYWLAGNDLLVKYKFEDTDLTVIDESVFRFPKVAENIASLNFIYHDKNNAETDDKNAVRSITISITAQTPSNQIDRTGGTNNTRNLETTVYCRNLGI